MNGPALIIIIAVNIFIGVLFGYMEVTEARARYQRIRNHERKSR